MRQPGRRFLLLLSSAVALLQLSCGREVTGPGSGIGGRVASIALDPQMPAQGTLFAEAQGISTVVPFDRVRITVQRQSEVQSPSTALAYDRTLPFPSTSDSIALNVSVPLGEGDTEGVNVALRIAYINAQGDTVFRGGPASTFAPLGGSTEPVALAIRYTGVGSQATSVLLSPDTGTVVAGTTTLFTAEARDTTGAISGTPLYFYTPDTARALIANPAVGSVQWRPSRGVARIIALHPDGLLADTSTYSVTLPAFKLVLSGGNAQSALAGTTLPQPIVVRTLAADDVPVPGVIVTFAVSAGGGSLTVVTDTSDANGEVSTAWTLGSPLGTQSITASAAGLIPAPLTISANSLAGPTAIALNITSPIGASRYYAIVVGGTIPDEVVGKVDASFARTATLNVPVPAGTGYSIYVLAADSLTPLPDTLPVISAGKRITNVNVPTGNTITIPVTLEDITLAGTVPSIVNAGEPFQADVTLTDPSGLFYDIFTSINLYRSDSIVATDRAGSASPVPSVETISATQKRFAGAPFRPSVAGTIYSQYGGGVATTDRKVIFYIAGPSRQRNENLLATTVTPAAAGVRVNITSPVAVSRFVVAVDTGAGPVAWGSATGAGLTTASVEVPVPAGTNYRVRVAALDDFGFSAVTFATLASLRAGSIASAVTVSASGFTDLPLSLELQTNSLSIPSVGTSGVGVTFSGTMRDPSLFNATAACLIRYSTAGPITTANLGTLLTTNCAITNRQANGTFNVAGTFPSLNGPVTLYSQVFTSVIGFQPNGARVEMLHFSIGTTAIAAP